MNSKTLVGGVVLVVAWVIWSFLSPLMQATGQARTDPTAGPTSAPR